jgi:hypothetical protein
MGGGTLCSQVGWGLPVLVRSDTDLSAQPDYCNHRRKEESAAVAAGQAASVARIGGPYPGAPGLRLADHPLAAPADPDAAVA